MSQSNDGRKAFIAGTALGTAIRVKLSGDTVIATTAGDEGIGTTTEGALINAPVNVRLDNHSVEATAVGAITKGADCYAGAAGAMSASLNGRRQGIALEAASTTEQFEMMPVGPNS